MDGGYDSWKKGEYPGHHLWGVTNLNRYGIEFDILPYEKYVFLNKLGNHLKLGGYLDQQLRAMLNYSQYDLIYSACQSNTFTLALLRYFGFFKKPIVALVHHPIIGNHFKKKIFVKGHDKLLCISNMVAKQLQDEFAIDDRKIEFLAWGVDLSFYETETDDFDEYNSSFIVSAGKTERDHDTLVRAFANIDYPLKIYCSGESSPRSIDISSNIEVIFNHPTDNAISYCELLKAYRQSYAVAIPLNEISSLAGLTSLLDAMAMAKPVVMTKNVLVDIDIEKEGIGIWVKPGDVEGWQQAVACLLSQPKEAKEMGKRGYLLSKEKYNIENYSSNLARILHSINI